MNADQLQAGDLSPEKFPLSWAALHEGIRENVAPGFVVGFWSGENPDQIFLASHGLRRKVPSELPLGVDTVFDLASLTKVFATAPLAAVLVERGWLSWDTPLCTFFPGYPHSEIRVSHLLSHTAGFSAWRPFWEEIRTEFYPKEVHEVSIEKRQAYMRKLLLKVIPDSKPGTQAVYSDISFLLLGFILEEVTAMPLDQAVKKFLWDPMGVTRAYFQRISCSPEKGRRETVAATEDCSWRRGVLQGQVHDDNCWAMGGYGGHAGVFGTARDLLHFSRSLFHGFFSPSVRQAMWTRVAGPVDCSRTLGWDTPSGLSSSSGSYFSTRSVGHLGFTGTSLWLDPEVNLAVVVLSNRVHPSRENIKIRLWRPLFHNALRKDLERL